MAALFREIAGSIGIGFRHASYTKDRLEIGLASDIELEFSVVPRYEDGSISQFLHLPMKTNFQGEDQVSMVRMGGADNRTIGYIFPVISLNGAYSDHWEDWKRNFGGIAVEGIIAGSCSDSRVQVSSLEQLVNCQSFDCIFSDDLAVGVFSRKALADLSVDESQLRLMVCEHGYELFDHSLREVGQCRAAEFSKRIILNRPSVELADRLDYLLLFVHNARGMNVFESRFLALYQIFELLIGLIFSSSISRIVEDSKKGLDVWQIRDRLQENASEKRRLSRLRSNCVSHDVCAGAYSDSEDACRQLLSSCGEAVKDGMRWEDVFYGVRNIVVHRQDRLAGVPREALEGVLVTTERLVFSIVKSFRCV